MTGAGGARCRSGRRSRRALKLVIVLAPVPSSESWWDVPVAETSAPDSNRRAREAYEQAKARQPSYL